MKESYSLKECNTKGFKGSIDDYIACIKSNDISSIEENNDKPGIHDTIFKAIFDKEDLTPYFDAKLIEELNDYSRNYDKAEIAYKKKQEDDLAKWASLDEEGRKLWAEEKRIINDENIVKAMNQIEKEIWFDMRDKEVNQHDINNSFYTYKERMAEIQKQKEELYKRHDAKIAEIRKQYPLTPAESFLKKEHKFINWLKKLLKNVR